MKKFIAKVNGNEYVVELIEVSSDNTVQAAPAPTPVVAPVATPTPTPTPAAPAPTQVASGTQGSVSIEAPMPGTILGIKVNVGQAVKKHQVLVVLEAMKMENDIVATQDGTVASINVNSGQSVEAGQLLVTLD